MLRLDPLDPASPGAAARARSRCHGSINAGGCHEPGTGAQLSGAQGQGRPSTLLSELRNHPGRRLQRVRDAGRDRLDGRWEIANAGCFRARRLSETGQLPSRAWSRRRRGPFTSGAQITYEDNANSIKHRLWEETDRAYRAAAERLIRIQTNTQVRVAEQDASADFSSAEPRSRSPRR